MTETPDQLNARKAAIAEAVAAERERIEALLLLPAAVLQNELRGRIDGSSIRRDEREKCARTVEEVVDSLPALDGEIWIAAKIAAAIRRGE